MKTEAMIGLVAAAGGAVPRLLAVRRLATFVFGVMVAAVLFWAVLGLRPDVGVALTTWRFDIKIVIVAAVVAAAGAYSILALRPLPAPTAGRGLVLASLVLAGGVVLELVVSPPAEWAPRLWGTNGLRCLAALPLLAAGPLLAFTVLGRSLAPANPTRAGAGLGLLAGGIGAAFYALHCVDDSPLFLAFWYVLALAIVTGLGAVLGRQALRW